MFIRYVLLSSHLNVLVMADVANKNQPMQESQKSILSYGTTSLMEKKTFYDSCKFAPRLSVCVKR